MWGQPTDVLRRDELLELWLERPDDEGQARTRPYAPIHVFPKASAVELGLRGGGASEGNCPPGGTLPLHV